MRLARNYTPLNVNIVKGQDIYLWDNTGKKYIDLLAGYSAVNQGHCHPKLINKMIQQANNITLTSRVVNNDKLNEWADYITAKFKYGSVLAMNSGAEAVETAIKLAHKYGNNVLQIKKPLIACLTNNFHGRTLGTLSLSDYKQYRDGFTPLNTNIIYIEMNDLTSLYDTFDKHRNNIAAFIYEPVQGEGGVMPITPEFAYAMEICKLENPDILFMADEIQCGLGRICTMTASETIFTNLRPDVLILGKALSGGIMPMSCILADDTIMSLFTAGTHGSTYGGNPLASAISIEALKIIENECIPNVKNSIKHIVNKMESISNNNIVNIRGRGLFWGIQFDNNYDIEALRERMLNAGYITCTSRFNTLRITPPLTITQTDFDKSIDTLNDLI